MSEKVSNDMERKISMQACNILNELRNTGQLCDAVVKVEDGHFTVHRAIMSACSPYFRALFTNGMHQTDQKEVFIPGITSDMMGLIIDYAYTRSTNVTSANVERLLPAADQFHVLGLVRACCDFLAKSLEHDNVIGIKAFAKNFFCRELERTCNRFIMEHFCEIATKSNELLSMSVPGMVEIISSDELNVKNEELVFNAIVRWINHDKDHRKSHIVELLKCMRLGLLTTQYFVETVKVRVYLIINTLSYLLLCT